MIGNCKEIYIRDAKFNISGYEGKPIGLNIQNAVEFFNIKDSQFFGRFAGKDPTAGFNIGAKKALVLNTDIRLSSSSSGVCFGIAVSSTNKEIYLENNYVFCDAMNNSSEGYDSMAIQLSGGKDCKAHITGGYYFGTYCGADIRRSTYVTGGRFTSCGHGGFYFSSGGDLPSEVYINDATLGGVIYEGEFNSSEMNLSPMGSFYIGGTQGGGGNNNRIYMNNCTLLTANEEYSGVLRNTSGEKDNTLYISNTIIPTSIRVDEGHYIVAGESMSITESNVSNINNVSYTDERYIYNPYVRGVESVLDRIIEIQNTLIGGNA